MPDGFKIEIYDFNGKQIYKDMSDARSKQFKFRSEKGKSYFMIVRPGGRTQPNQNYTLPLHVKAL